MAKKTEKKNEMDLQLLEFDKQSKKLRHKFVWNLAKDGIKDKNIQKITGLSYADSKFWNPCLNANIYLIKPEFRVEWVHYLSQLFRVIVSEIPFSNAAQKKLITSDYINKSKNERTLVIRYGNIIKKLYITRSNFGGINKYTQPNAFSRKYSYQGRKGKKSVVWNRNAVFQEFFIKITENIWIRFRQTANEKIISERGDDIKDKEKKGETLFVASIGYCKIAGDEKYMYGNICLCNDYVNETVMDIVSLNGEKLDQLCLIMVEKNNKKNVILYSNESLYLNNINTSELEHELPPLSMFSDMNNNDSNPLVFEEDIDLYGNNNTTQCMPVLPSLPCLPFNTSISGVSYNNQPHIGTSSITPSVYTDTIPNNQPHFGNTGVIPANNTNSNNDNFLLSKQFEHHCELLWDICRRKQHQTFPTYSLKHINDLLKTVTSWVSDAAIASNTVPSVSLSNNNYAMQPLRKKRKRSFE